MLLNVLRYLEPLRQRSIQPQSASQTKAEKPCITASPEHQEAETSGDTVTTELRKGARGSRPAAVIASASRFSPLCSSPPPPTVPGTPDSSPPT